MKINYLAIALTFIAAISYAQQVSTPIDIESHISKILISKGEEADNQPYYELLMQFYNNPIAINSCTESELMALQLLTNNQIKTIIEYRNQNSVFENKYELLAVNSLTLEKIKEILPFISFNKPLSISALLKQSIKGKDNHMLASGFKVIEPAKGFYTNTFLGDPYQYNFRLKITNSGHTSMGITLQKDPGELLFRTDSAYLGPDFYSFHYYVQNQGRIKQLALGDFKLQFGQGLLLGAGFLIGKNANSITSIQSTLKIQPYTSLTEFNFFRGIGTTVAISKNWEASLFYSNQKKDASTFISDSTEYGITSLRTSGLHRTLSEISAQNTIQEQVLGTSITYTKGSLEVGILGLYNSFNIPFEPKSSLSNIHKFRGKENYNASIFGRYNYQNITFYGEAASTLHKGSALNLGVISSISKNIDFSFQYRYFAPNFHSFYGVSFAENTLLSNEKGAYWGLYIRLSPSITVMSYFDMYKFPWLKSTLPQPSSGTDGLIRVNYKLKKSALFYTQVQTETKDRKTSVSTIQNVMPHKLIKYILNLDYNLDSPLSFRSRLQWTKSYFEETDVGLLIYQDINLKIKKTTLSSRYAIFDTNGFLSRQYMYEKDVLYAFSTPQFNGKGIRYYFMAKYTPLKNVTFRAKWSQTIYYDRTLIGSGSSEIVGNKKSQFTLQLKYNF